MNKDQVLGLVRDTLKIVGGVFVTKGSFDASEVEIIAGAIVAIVGVVWSQLDKRKGKQIG